MTLDLGQGSELNQVRERALAAGAVRAHVLDVCEAFARGYVLPALQAGALYEGRYPLAAALARPLMAQKLVELAAMEGATAIAHGSTGKGNGQARLDLAVRALNPSLRILAPARGWSMTRAQESRMPTPAGSRWPPPLSIRTARTRTSGDGRLLRRPRGPLGGTARQTCSRSPAASSSARRSRRTSS